MLTKVKYNLSTFTILGAYEDLTSFGRYINPIAIGGGGIEGTDYIYTT